MGDQTFPSAPPADIYPSSPPPSYVSSRTLGNNDNNDQPTNSTPNILSSDKKATKFAAGNLSDVAKESSPTAAVVVLSRDKVAVLCFGHKNNCFSCVDRPLRLINYCNSGDRLTNVQTVSANGSGPKMRKLLALSCCAFSTVIFALFAFAVGFVVILLINSQATESDVGFDQYQKMRMFGHHFG
ncbi:hypothetical protein GPALN_005144 [Globodera pallida]|nr:hypothetical protein GPALN_005144 [Globodera pallida]